MKLLVIIILLAFYFNNATTQAPPKVIHVFVALCDNINQGIVPVPAKIGNGEDPANNLYWGAFYGIKTHFKRSKEWQFAGNVATKNKYILERCVFKHKIQNVIIIADAYKGAEIRKTTEHFLAAASGANPEKINIAAQNFMAGGAADMLVYIGHNGLMDFSIDKSFKNVDGKRREAIILACASRNYFAEHLKVANAFPVLWTANLMAPEAYTLEAALAGWILNENHVKIRARAVSAYSKYQKCGQKAAENILVTGF